MIIFLATRSACSPPTLVGVGIGSCEAGDSPDQRRAVRSLFKPFLDIELMRWTCVIRARGSAVFTTDPFKHQIEHIACNSETI